MLGTDALFSSLATSSMPLKYRWVFLHLVCGVGEQSSTPSRAPVCEWIGLCTPCQTNCLPSLDDFCNAREDSRIYFISGVPCWITVFDAHSSTCAQGGSRHARLAKQSVLLDLIHFYWRHLNIYRNSNSRPSVLENGCDRPDSDPATNSYVT